MQKAHEAITAILKGRPETKAENKAYLAEIVECFSYFTDQELTWISDPRDGLRVRCKYLPTPADAYEIIKEHRDQIEKGAKMFAAFGGPKPDTTEYPSEVARPDYDRRRAVVKAALGYNPGDPSAPKRALVPPTGEDLDRVFANLKSPPVPPSAELLALIAEQDAR